jgi:hypothetical protein
LVVPVLTVALLLGTAAPAGAVWGSEKIRARVKTFDRWYSGSADARGSRGRIRIWNKRDKAQIIYCSIEALANGKRVGMWRDQIGKFFKDGHNSRLVFWKIPNGAGTGRDKKPVRAWIKQGWIV